MTNAPSEIKKIIFGEFWLESSSRTLCNDDQQIHLAKRPFDVLLFLIENRERVISRNELLDKFWDGHDVYDDALRKCVGTIRHSLNDHTKPPRFIETRYGSGYRFIGLIEETSTINLEKHKSHALAANLFTNGAQNAPLATINAEPEIIQRNSRSVLLTILIASLLFFVSLGFYVYFPDGNAKQSDANNLIEAAAPVRSIAVLPLKNLTGNANNEYFSDGVTESIINQLSRVKELRIISHSSTFALKDQVIEPPEIGRKLNVDAFLEGSLQQKDDLLSVSVRLISTRDGSVLWTSQNFERPLANAYELQDTISCNIAIELRTELCDTFPHRNTSNPDAYQAYLKGRFQWNKRTAEGIKQSIALYEQAIGFDSRYALAYAGLAESYEQGIWYVPFDSKEVLPKAEEAARKAIELDDSLAEAHVALSSAYGLNWHWSEAERELRRAVELNPRYARAHHSLAFYFSTLGRSDEAIVSIRRAKELDPLNLVINSDEASLLFSANRTDEAFEQWKKTLELDPNSAYTYRERSLAYQVLGNESASFEDYAKFMELSGESAEKIAEYRRTAKQYGFKAIWQKDLNNLLAQEKRGEKVSFISPAVFYALLGQKDEAFKYLEKAYNDHSAEMLLLKPYRAFASLRSDPRFTDLLKRMGLPE